ncbi:hypothetical protein BD626DRAFT_403258 [Schizophyllum amplum]|uniref:Erythromycin biosynthesis protein CIII-like C-terminal domain-containing protein n=1 Tax=Schizophyllum amplum TaxID=97359 RepID=A0A550CDC6_9AGAR|nr:hypothetical protein BD626DRAFT_403258 [Auriculariopsis ampla]
MIARQRILFLTNSEQGQSNVQLATAFEVHSRASHDVEVHLASFGELRARFERMAGTMQDNKKPPTFHLIDGLPHFVAMDRIKTYGSLPHPPTVRACAKFVRLMVPWTPEEYMTIVEHITILIDTLDPHLIIVDNVFSQAMDACTLLHRPYHILSPILPSLVCSANQPFFRRLLRNPQMATGLPYPLPLTGILVNLAHIVVMSYLVLTSTHLKALNAARAARGCTGPYPGMNLTHVAPGRTYITPGVRELDIPFVQPEGLRLCGPISPDFVPLHESDPELAAWLDRGETVLMIMGTHFEYDEPMARRVLKGLLGGVGAATQILWKLPNRDLLGALLDDTDRVRAVSWFVAEPAAILAHENVVCYVHHGGANSYLECAWAGKPQVILAQWSDTYYNAVAAEYRGIGVYGNKTCAPAVDAEEFSSALRRVTSGEESARFKARADQVGVRCREAGGRRFAANVVLALLQGGNMV